MLIQLAPNVLDQIMFLVVKYLERAPKMVVNSFSVEKIQAANILKFLVQEIRSQTKY